MYFGTWFKSFGTEIMLFKFACPKVNRNMHCKLEEKEIRDIETTNVVQQTSFWARVKYQQGLKPFAFEYAASEDLLNPASNGQKFIKFHD